MFNPPSSTTTTGGPFRTHTPTPLSASVANLSSSLGTLTSTISTLASATSDFPRLAKVLSVHRHFELLSEPEIHAAQAALRGEIVPEFHHLLGKVSAQLERMERREKSLAARSELLKGRMEGAPLPGRNNNSSSSSMMGRHDANSAARANAEKMRQLRAKKERLQYTVERLSLEKSQKVSLFFFPPRLESFDRMAN